MNLYISLFALVLSLIVLDVSARTPTSYRRRHLTPYEEVCRPTAAPYPYSPSGKGKGGTTTSGTGKGSTPTYGTGKGSTPTSGKGSTPTSGKGSTPTGGKGSTTTSGKGSTTTSGKGSTPTSGKGSTPTSGKGSTPTSGKGSTPTSGKGSTSSSGKGSTSSSGKGSSASGTSGGTGQSGYRQRELQTISLITSLSQFSTYPLSPSFSANVLLTWPNDCFSAEVTVENFIPSCVGCSFDVTSDDKESCVGTTDIPFVDLTEVASDPYSTGVTNFNTDASGKAQVIIPVICTGTGPLDNVERPFLLRDPVGNIAACGILTYKCS